MELHSTHTNTPEAETGRRRRMAERQRWLTRISWATTAAAFSAFFALWANAGGILSKASTVAVGTTATPGSDHGGTQASAGSGTEGGASTDDGPTASGDANSFTWGRHHHRSWNGGSTGSLSGAAGGSYSDGDSGSFGGVGGQAGSGQADIGQGWGADFRTGAS